MSGEDGHFITIDILKKRSPGLTTIKPSKSANTTLQKTLKTGKSQDLVRKRLVSDGPALQVKEFTKEGALLLYKLYVKRQEQMKHKQGIAISMPEKYKIISAALRKRLHVNISSNDVRAIKDVDTNFFGCVTGRPFVHYVSAFKSLGYVFNKQMRLNHHLGFTKDNILNIAQNHRKEERNYAIALDKYYEQLKLFDNYISNDYKKSMKCLIRCDELVLKVNDKIAQLQTLATEIFTIKSRLIGLSYLYGHHQKYGRFLYYLSPPLWRLKNREFARSVEIEAKGFDFKIFSEEDTFNEIFENMKKECAGGLIRPALYFTHPDDIIKTFDVIEKQQLNHFIHVIHVTPRTKSLRDSIEQLKAILVKDTASVMNNITSFEKLLAFYDDVCSQLKGKFFRLVNGSFYNVEGSLEALKLKLHLEFCYEKVYLDKPINMDIVTLTKSLELFYIDYSERLDAIHSDKIKAAVARNLLLERNKNRRAKLAARDLQLFSRLERSLQRACEPVMNNNLPALPAKKVFSTRKIYKRFISQGNEKKVSLPRLTEAEREYLALFTDWTDTEDPANYLQSLRISKDQNLSLR